MSYLYSTVGLLLVVCAAALPNTPEPAFLRTSFVLIGDSTTANGTTPNSGGWGNGLCGSQITGNIPSVLPGTPCINTAHNGATTGSFVADGYEVSPCNSFKVVSHRTTSSFWNISLSAIQGEVAAGRKTIVTIQFGHNDQKIAPPESMAANLTSMVQQIRGIGGVPVLVTSLTRRTFNADGTISDTLAPWANGTSWSGSHPLILVTSNDHALPATISVAEQEKTHWIDLHKASIAYVRLWP
ncbi:hypothetical protein C0991_010630 [Blastosporella zonata]|nr:hypothetical protein C0991_010630 [Blastosporella zonata]